MYYAMLSQSIYHTDSVSCVLCVLLEHNLYTHTHTHTYIHTHTYNATCHMVHMYQDVPTDHMTLVWPVKFCDGIKQYRRVRQTTGKITVCKKQTENH
jgi:hypothetical protein